MNLTLKIISGNRTTFQPVGHSPAIYRHPEDEAGRVAKVYDTREENMHEIFKADEAYLVNGYGKTMEVVYRPELHCGGYAGSWSDKALKRVMEDVMPNRDVEIKDGQVFINDAFVQDEMITNAAVHGWKIGKTPIQFSYSGSDQRLMENMTIDDGKPELTVRDANVDVRAVVGKLSANLSRSNTPGGIFHELLKRLEGEKGKGKK